MRIARKRTWGILGLGLCAGAFIPAGTINVAWTEKGFTLTGSLSATAAAFVYAEVDPAEKRISDVADDVSRQVQGAVQTAQDFGAKCKDSADKIWNGAREDAEKALASADKKISVGTETRQLARRWQ